MSMWTPEPADKEAFTAEFDTFYTGFSRTYERFVKLLPIWRRWLESALPAIEGPRILEVAFGTGYLLTKTAVDHETYGIDINAALIEVARENLRRSGLTASLSRGSVEELPFTGGYFDTVYSTMAFSGFPDGEKALAEMTRVLKPGGKLVLVDVSLPVDGNPLGTLIARAFEAGGDILRDMDELFGRFYTTYQITPAAGFGSIQRVVAAKNRKQK